MIELSILGTPDLRDASGRPVDNVLSQPKRLALLAYLSLASHRAYCRRDALLALLWSERDPERARGALRQAMHHLRRSLGEDAFLRRGESELGVDPGRVRCDALEFAVALAEGRTRDALQLYQGDLLPGFFVSRAPAFERWLEAERERLQVRACCAAIALASRDEQEGRYGEAVAWARRALEIRPASEEALRRLMTLLGRTGEPADALQAFARFSRWLRDELDAEPSAETRSLAHAIGGGRPPL